MKNKILIGLVAAMILLLTGTVMANPNWGTGAGKAGCSVGHINPPHPNWKFGEIYPGPDDCGFLNGEAEKGSQQTLPDAVPFIQALPPA